MIQCIKCTRQLIVGSETESERIVSEQLGWACVERSWGLGDEIYKWICNNCNGWSMPTKTKIEKEEIMNMKIGESVEHGGQKFVIVDIKHHATMDGVALVVTAYDPNMADKEQQKQIKMDQTSQNIVDMLKKVTEGGGLDFGGFKLGGS
jgi:hypothetical protein